MRRKLREKRDRVLEKARRVRAAVWDLLTKTVNLIWR